MSIEFLCEACGAKLRIEDDSAGKTVKCPNCSAVVSTKPAEDAAAASPFGEVGPARAPVDDDNPYASPMTTPAPGAGSLSPAGASTIPHGIQRALSQTRPWVIFLSILGFVCGGFMTLGSVGILVAAVVSGEPGMILFGPMYLVYAALYLAGSYFLFVYGLRIGSFQRSNSFADLESALVAQKSFWKLVGIVIVVGFVLGVVALVGVLGFTVMTDVSRF
jgi:DNA-directed RNA polymerase subunit RPC12/RpoP